MSATSDQLKDIERTNLRMALLTSMGRIRDLTEALQDGIENMGAADRVLWRNRVIKLLAEGK